MIVSSGNLLVVKAAIDSGCKFFAGYPITPSSEIAHKMSDELPKVGGAFIQMEDEISGIAAVLGASMSGVKAMTASSGPGISLKAEQIGYAFMAEIPLVIVDVMRAGPSTGLPTRVSQGDILQVRNPTHGDYKSIALIPGSLEEAYTETIRAFNLAERYMTPVFLLLDETIAKMEGGVNLPKNIEVYNRKTYLKDDYMPYKAKADEPAVLNPFFKGHRYHITGLYHDESGFPTENENIVSYSINRLMNKIKDDEVASFEEYKLGDAEICIIAYGSVSLAAKQAINLLEKEGVKVGLFRPKTLWPSPAKKLREIASRFDRVLVCELNLGQYLVEIERATLRDDFETLLQANGRAIPPAKIIAKIKEML